MTSVGEITLAPVSVRDDSVAVAEPVHDPSFSAWALDGSTSGGRATPVLLTVLGLLSGIGALVLGALAVLSATGAGAGAGVAPVERGSQAAATVSGVERQVLALLAKPSTERIVFRGSGGRLVLAAGSGGRAAILLRGFPRAKGGNPYYAWVFGPGKQVRAARFVGTERAVFLTGPVARGESVVVARERPARPARATIVATRS